MQNLTPENYVMKFGKYKNMRAVDIADIYEVDKNGDDKPVGILYLKFLVEKCDWFKHKDIIEQIIKNAIDCMSGSGQSPETLEGRCPSSGDDEKEPEPTPKETKQKKDKKPKKEAQKVVSDTTVINIVE